MNTREISQKLIVALSLLTLVMSGLAGCGSLEVGAMAGDAAADADQSDPEFNGIEFGIEPTPMPEMLTYRNNVYGFQFEYPETWTLSEEDHRIVLKMGSNRLEIFFRWANENVRSERRGMAAGTPIYSNKVHFMGQILPEYVVEYEHKAKYVIYSDTGMVEIDDLDFEIVLEDLTTDYITLELPEEIISEARRILESFERIEASGTPPQETAATTTGAPEVTHVVAWLGHIASLPEGSQYDDMVVLSPEGTGEFGLLGSTPEIEAEIQSLRDAEGPYQYAHLWGTLACGGIEDYNDCQLSVDRLQYGANYSEEEIADWFGTITSSTFNDGESFVFQLEEYFPMWYSIHASQSEALQAQIQHFLETGEVVEVSGKLLVGFPDVNGTRIEISSIEARSMAGPRPDITDGIRYENLEYGFSFQYGSQMSVVEEANSTSVTQDNVQLIIDYRRVEEDIRITDIGELTGQFHPYGEVFFLGEAVQPILNIIDGKIAAVYLGGPGVELGEGTPLRFVVRLIHTDETWISNAQVDAMLQIFHNFALTSD